MEEERKGGLVLLRVTRMLGIMLNMVAVVAVGERVLAMVRLVGVLSLVQERVVVVLVVTK